MMNLMKRLWKEEEGQDLIEYALLIALVALGSDGRNGQLGRGDQQRIHDLGIRPDQRDLSVALQ